MVYDSTAFSVLASGNEVELDEPDPTDVEYADVERGLAQTNRYNGQTEPLQTVAHHSVLVSRVAEERGLDERVQLYALLHDAAEAYLGDLPRPTKNLVDGDFMARYERAEEEMLDAIHAAFGLDAVPGPRPAEREAIDRIDKQVALAEGYGLGGAEIGRVVEEAMDDSTWERSTEEVLAEDWVDEIEWDRGVEESRRMFRDRFADLYGEVLDGDLP